MTCTSEVITPGLWEEIKGKFSSDYKRVYIRREFEDRDFIGGNRIIHLESGNFMCHSPIWIPALPCMFYLYVMGSQMFVFTVEDFGPRKLEFHYLSSIPEPALYPVFCEQVSEIFSVAGKWLIMPENLVFVPQFPAFADCCDGTAVRWGGG